MDAPLARRRSLASLVVAETPRPIGDGLGERSYAGEARFSCHETPKRSLTQPNFLLNP